METITIQSQSEIEERIERAIVEGGKDARLHTVGEPLTDLFDRCMYLHDEVLSNVLINPVMRRMKNEFKISRYSIILKLMGLEADKVSDLSSIAQRGLADFTLKYIRERNFILKKEKEIFLDTVGHELEKDGIEIKVSDLTEGVYPKASSLYHADEFDLEAIYQMSVIKRDRKGKAFVDRQYFLRETKKELLRFSKKLQREYYRNFEEAQEQYLNELSDSMRIQLREKLIKNSQNSSL